MVTEWQGRVQQRGFLIPPPLAGEGLRSRRASSPVFFTAPGRPSLIVRRAAPKKSRGRAGRQGSKRTRGPRHLAASRRAEVRITRLRSCELRRASRKSAQPKASRARCLEVCSASPPVDFPVWRPPPPLSNWKAAYPPLGAQVGSGEPVTGAVPAITGPRRRAAGAPGRGGLDRRLGDRRRISSVPNRPPLPAPRQKTLDQTPLGHEGGI